MTLPDEFHFLGPTVIGATGGASTCVVARMARHGGLYIGTKLNQAEDALALHPLTL